MKFDFLKSISPLEIILFIVFVFYIIFPINTPEILIPIINSCFGLAFILIVVLYVFFYTTPVLAVLSILVAYEIIRRSSNNSSSSSKLNRKYNNENINIPEYSPTTQEKKDEKMLEMNPVKVETLEEEVVLQMAPVGKSDTNTYIETSYKPIADPLFCGGSMCK